MLEYIKKIFNTNISFFILLAIIVFFLYGKSINYGFTKLDDDTLITKNINFISDLKNIPKLFTISAFYNNSTLYYRPILSISFALESFFVRDNIWLYHLTNIILFILALYLLYLFCLCFKLNVTITKFIILIIAVHPMFSSVVVWIPGRNDSLLVLLFLASFICFIKYINTKKVKFAILFVLFFIASLFTKETFVLLIPLYFIYCYFYKYEIQTKKIIYLFTILIPFLIIYFVLRNISVTSLGYEYYILNLSVVVLNFIKDTAIYFYNFFVPEYIPIIVFDTNISIKIILYDCLFLMILSFILYKKMISKRLLVFSIIFMLLSIFPTFLQKDDIYLNHRFFICSIAISLVIISILQKIILKFNKLKLLFILLFVLIFSSYCYISSKQADKYENSVVFWTNAYIDSPNYYVTCINMSNIYRDQGNLIESRRFLEKAISLKSTYSTLIDYANLLMAFGDFEQSENALLLLEQDMKGSKEYVYYPLSEVYYQKKDYNKALKYALKSCNLVPYNINYNKQLIKIYDTMNLYDKELEIYKNLLKYDKRNQDYESKIDELNKKIADIKET